MKRIALFFIAGLLFTGSLPLFAQDFQIPAALTDWLNNKKYDGAKRQYTQADLDNVPAEVMRALAALGVSHFTVLRNEMYARHGYIFKTPVLLTVYSQVSWYRQDPTAGLNALTAMEVRNVNWIKGIEDKYDYEVIIDFMSKRTYWGESKLYSTTSSNTEAPLALPTNVQLAFNHLYVNPAQFFRSEIFARNGYMYTDGFYKRIFSGTPWYKPVTNNDKVISGLLNQFERANLALLREREWVEIVNAVKFSLPEGVTSIPVIGFNSLFIKTVKFHNYEFHFSLPDAWTAMEEEGAGLDDHMTSVNELVEAAIVERIEAEPDPVKKLVHFFNNKKYKGYVDTVQFNGWDLETPTYLQEAVASLGLDWKLLLRKEIHARNGARFIDPKVGPIFKACSWYKSKYNLNPRTVSRFPSGVKISNQELKNYSLLEGEELFRRLVEMNRVLPGAVKACDLLGNFYFIKIETVTVGSGEQLEAGHAFKTIEEYNNNDSLQTIINDLTKPFDFDLQQYRQQEEEYFYGGC